MPDTIGPKTRTAADDYRDLIYDAASPVMGRPDRLVDFLGTIKNILAPDIKDESGFLGGSSNAVVPPAIKAARTNAILASGKKPAPYYPGLLRSQRLGAKYLEKPKPEPQIFPAEPYKYVGSPMPGDQTRFMGGFPGSSKATDITVKNPLFLPGETKNGAVLKLLGRRDANKLLTSAFSVGAKMYAKPADYTRLAKYISTEDIANVAKEKYPGLVLQEIVADRVLSSKGYDSLIDKNFKQLYPLQGTRKNRGAANSILPRNMEITTIAPDPVRGRKALTRPGVFKSADLPNTPVLGKALDYFVIPKPNGK